MSRVRCVGAVITGADGGLLLVLRGHPPEAGRWSLPGGKVEAGETDQQALIREVREETGLHVTPGRLVGTVERPAPGQDVLDIRDYAATVTGGELDAGDDAADARWVPTSEVDGLPLTTGLAEALRAWGVLPTPPQPPLPLITEAMRRTAVIWLTLPGQPARPAWHVWDDGAAWLVTGPGEQPLPGLDSGAPVSVTVPSKESGAALVHWRACAERVEPGSPAWGAAATRLAAARLNARLDPGETTPAGRWEHSAAIFRLTPRIP